MNGVWPLPPVLAHRCGGALAPENTLAGLDAAAASGCRGVEFDVMMSAEGTPLLIHDETLQRTTDGHGRIADTPDEVLFGLDAGSWFDPRFAGERLPTLDQALIRCAGLGLAVNLEIKPATGHEATTGAEVGRSLRERWMGFPCALVLSSFSEVALRAVAAECPAWPRGLLVGRIPPDWHSRCADVGAIALHASSRGLGATAVQAVRSAGLHLAVYTENNVRRAADLLAWGVDTVITDHPERFREPPFR